MKRRMLPVMRRSSTAGPCGGEVMRTMVWYDSSTGSYASVLDPYTVERILLVMAAAMVAGL
eukprot:10682507-Heterocapsa_arctica.AAC.1